MSDMADMTTVLGALARDAYVWGLPLVQTRLYLRLAARRDMPFNQLYGSTSLSTPASHVPLPNVDTLYGLGWLDLGAEPQILSVPDTQDRYYLIQLNDAWLNSFCYIGRRATGTRAGQFAIVAPGWRGVLPAGVTRIDAPTRHVLALSRVLVDDAADLPAAVAVQSAFALTPLSAYPAMLRPSLPIVDAFNNFPILDPASLGVGYFDELCAGLVDNPPPAADQPFVDALAVLGLRPGAVPSREASPARRALLAAAARAGDEQVRGRKEWLLDSREVNGWTVAYGITSFIGEPLARAAVARLGPGCLVPQEGLYFTRRLGPDGAPLSGARAYEMVFPAGQLPPVDAFWSLTLYGHDMALVENPIQRYAIGDRTRGLRLEADGSLRLRIQHAMPADGPANWLPAPAPDAPPYLLFARTYQPRPALASGAYALPPVTLAAP
ncbi:DUF1254 domain-containing protein [Parapedomonas caeni]